jgi:DNA transformation protein
VKDNGYAWSADRQEPKVARAAPRCAPARSLARGASGPHRSIEQLRRCDPFDVYARLKRQQSGLSLNMLYALIGAVEDRDWREVARTDRTSILMRLDDMGLLKRSRK